MAATSNPKRPRNGQKYSAVNVHKSRLKKLNKHRENALKNQGYRVDENIKDLTSRYDEASGASTCTIGHNIRSYVKVASFSPQVNAESIEQFTDFPLSENTLKG